MRKKKEKFFFMLSFALILVCVQNVRVPFQLDLVSVNSVIYLFSINYLSLLI